MPDLGKKHECAECATRFYDLGKKDPVCPKCGANPKLEQEEVADTKPLKAKRTKAATKGTADDDAPDGAIDDADDDVEDTDEIAEEDLEIVADDDVEDKDEDEDDEI